MKTRILDALPLLGFGFLCQDSAFVLVDQKKGCEKMETEMLQKDFLSR